MKSIIVLTFFLVFGGVRLAAADDIVRSNAGKQHAAQPSTKNNNTHTQTTAGGRNSTVHAAKNRFGAQPNVKARQNYAVLAQPVARAPLAMNVQRTLPNYQPTETPDSPRGDHKIRGKTGRAKTGGGNNQSVTDNRRSYFDALKRCHHERHDRHWWNQHCRTIVFINTGYYYLDSGYWYPAYGYSSTYDYYDYDGPIYTYADLLPDQVIANVQAALREAGYYVGAITGSLNPATRAAISNFQRDYGLIITGAIDEPTVQSLGLN